MKKITLAFLALAFIITISCSSTAQIYSTMDTATATPFLPLSWVATETKRQDFTRTPEVITPTEEPFPTFGPPLDWPQSFDQLWEYIETGHRGYTFETCLPGEKTAPWITWDMLNEAVAVQTPERRHPYLEFYADDIARIIAPGGGYFPDEHRLVRVCEDTAFAQMILIEGEAMMDKNQPLILACGDNNKKPIIHGGGVQKFLDWLAVQPIASSNCPVYSPPAPGSII